MKMNIYKINLIFILIIILFIRDDRKYMVAKGQGRLQKSLFQGRK